MCVKTEQIGLLLLGTGLGLLLALAVSGWFLQLVLAGVLIVLGILLLK